MMELVATLVVIVIVRMNRIVYRMYLCYDVDYVFYGSVDTIDSITFLIRLATLIATAGWPSTVAHFAIVDNKSTFYMLNLTLSR